MLRAVLFDLDNTLVDRNAAFRECVRTRFQDPAVCAQLHQLDHAGHGNREALFAYWEQQSGATMTQSRFGQLLAQYIRPDQELIEALQTLASTLQLALITNGSGETQRHKINAAGLAEVFSPGHIWISGEIGIAKPDARIFHRACQALGESPANCLYLGDHEQDDLLGARNAGLRSHRVNAVLSAAELNRLVNQEVRG